MICILNGLHSTTSISPAVSIMVKVCADAIGNFFNAASAYSTFLHFLKNLTSIPTFKPGFLICG